MSAVDEKLATGVELVSPAFELATADPVRLAPGLEDLTGGSIGLVDNGKWNASALLEAVRQRLIERFEMSSGPLCRKQHYNRDLNDDERTTLSGAARVALAAIGDCGSCTSYTVKDALVLEALGVPTVALVTEPFRPLAEGLATTMGTPGIRLVSIQHPLYGLDDDGLAERAEAAVPAIVALLMEQRL